MIGEVLTERLKEYDPANAMEQENAIQEIMQHYALASLARSGFFKKGVFHGGTCLCILHGMNRFSEDLDFVLKKPDADFRWGPFFLDRIREDFESEGVSIECLDKSGKGNVKMAFLKMSSIGRIPHLELPFRRRKNRKIKIKLEIDANPPSGESWQTGYLHFPMIAAITNMTLESGFASKGHALLCRPFIKGRDWYDFWWYVKRNTGVNFELLENALQQQGPWKGKEIKVTAKWFSQKMKRRIKEIDWDKAREDVRRFLPLKEQQNLDQWSRDFFLHLADRIRG